MNNSKPRKRSSFVSLIIVLLFISSCGANGSDVDVEAAEEPTLAPTLGVNNADSYTEPSDDAGEANTTTVEVDASPEDGSFVTLNMVRRALIDYSQHPNGDLQFTSVPSAQIFRPGDQLEVLNWEFALGSDGYADHGEHFTIDDWDPIMYAELRVADPDHDEIVYLPHYALELEGSMAAESIHPACGAPITGSDNQRLAAERSFLGVNSLKKTVRFAPDLIYHQSMQSNMDFQFLSSDDVYSDHLGLWIDHVSSEDGEGSHGLDEEIKRDLSEFDEQKLNSSFIESVSLVTWSEDDASDCTIIADGLPAQNYSVSEVRNAGGGGGHGENHHWVVEYPGIAEEYWDQPLGVGVNTADGQFVSAQLSWNAYFRSTERLEVTHDLDL